MIMAAIRPHRFSNGRLARFIAHLRIQAARHLKTRDLY
jgi:hypothetical protein